MAKAYGFDQQGASRIARAVRAVERDPGRTNRRPSRIYPTSGEQHYLVKITGPVSGQVGRYDAKSYDDIIVSDATGNLAEANLGSLAEENDCIVWDVAQVGASTARLLANQRFIGRLVGTKKIAGEGGGAPTFKTIVEIDSGRAGVHFRVNLSQTGGSNGNKTTAATWTYTATDLYGNQVGTGLSPERPREYGTRTAATIGEGYYHTDGTFKLYDALEKPGTGGCA